MGFKTILYSENNDVARLTLNRPDKLNSFNEQMHGEISQALSRVRENDDIRCLLLTGSGRAFCSGQDLSARYESLKAGEFADLGGNLLRLYNPLVTSIQSLQIPVVCSVNGTIAGAGIGLALACDFVIAGESANFIFSFSNIGLVPDSGCSWSLVNCVGLAKAKAILMLGETVPARQAEQLGMIWKAVPDAELSGEVDGLLANLKARPRLSAGLCKQLVNRAAASSCEDQLASEARCQAVAGTSVDYRESVFAFVEKRKPVFE